VYTVQAGDTLSGIAAETLGDASRFIELFTVNRDRMQPDGGLLVDAGLIRPGWLIVIPTLDSPSTVPPPVPPDLAPEPGTSNATQPASTPPPVQLPVSPAKIPAPASGHPRPVDTDTVGSRPSQSDVEVVGLGIGGMLVLAAGLLLRLRWLRRRRSVRGACGHREGPVDRTERTLVAAADVPLVWWAGHMLAAVSGRSPGCGPLVVELAEDSGVEVLWEAPRFDVPPGWRATDGGWAWRCAYDPDLLVPTAPPGNRLRGLVTVGVREGRQLIVNLEAARTVAIVGPETVVDGLLGAMVIFMLRAVL
jgi:hypothetical protein